MSINSLFGTSRATDHDDETHWLSVSDLMAGLMMIFLFIAIGYMRFAQLEKEEIRLERDQVRQIATTWNNTRAAIYHSLVTEFKDDLLIWNAEIDRDTLTFRFKEPDVLFDLSSAQLKPKFKLILSNFFPRYLATLNQYQASLEEIRIEGHTSSEWNGNTHLDEAYFANMRLSQERTRSVLRYCYEMPESHLYPWLKSVIAAVGLSSSRPILVSGQENRERSRRVEFKVRTNVEKRMVQILQSTHQ